MSIELDQQCINTLRFLSVDMIQKANSGHPGLPLGAAPMVKGCPTSARNGLLHSIEQRARADIRQPLTLVDGRFVAVQFDSELLGCGHGRH